MQIQQDTEIVKLCDICDNSAAVFCIIIILFRCILFPYFIDTLTSFMCFYLAADNFALRFQRKGTSDYVIKRCMPNLTAVTVCLWMKTDDDDNKGTPLSYNVEGGDIEELRLFNYKRFTFSIANKHRYL